MSKKHFQLTDSQRIKGLRICFNNAVAFKDEAEILFKEKRWARSAALAILGIEEISKVELIGQSYFFNTQSQWNKFKRDFTKHNKKLSVADSLIIQVAYKDGDEKKVESELIEILKGRDLDIGKQKCLYVNYPEADDDWHDPLEKVEKPDAEECLRILNTLSDQYNLIFSRTDSELVDIVKDMMIVIPGDEMQKHSKKMRDVIRKKYEELKLLKDK